MKNPSIYCKAFLLSISILFLMGCAKSDDDMSYGLEGKWKVIYYVENGQKITKSEKSTWTDINNGNYTVESNGKISIGPISTTEIAEPAWTELFKIGLAENFEVNNLTLLIYYNNNKSLIALKRSS